MQAAESWELPALLLHGSVLRVSPVVGITAGPEMNSDFQARSLLSKCISGALMVFCNVCVLLKGWDLPAT